MNWWGLAIIAAAAAMSGAIGWYVVRRLSRHKLLSRHRQLTSLILALGCAFLAFSVAFDIAARNATCVPPCEGPDVFVAAGLFATIIFLAAFIGAGIGAWIGARTKR